MAQHTWARTSHEPAFLHRNASWRHMLAAQPPHGNLEEVIAYTGEDGLIDHTEIRTSPISNGLHMGYIYDKAELILRSQSDTYLVVLLRDWVLQGLTGIQHVDEFRQELECREWTQICRSAVGRGKWSGSDRITFYIEKPLAPHDDGTFPGDDASDQISNREGEFASQGREQVALNFTQWQKLHEAGSPLLLQGFSSPQG